MMRPVWPLFKRAFTTANWVQVISGFLGDWARRRGFKGPIDFIPNGFNPAIFTQQKSPHEVEELKQRLGKKEGDVYL